MKHKFLFFVVLLCAFCMRAQAQATYPFEFSSSWDADDAKWYSIQFRNQNGNTFAYVADANSTQLGQSTNGNSLTFEQKAFCFVQSGEGFYIYNKGTGLGVKVDDVADRAPVKVSQSPTLIKYRLNGSDHFLYDGEFSENIDNTLASWSNQDPFIAISAATARSNYNGARAVFTRIHEPIDYTINCTGLTGGETGGVCYNRVNYTGTLSEGDLDTNALIAMHVSGYNGTITSVSAEAKTISVAYSSAAEETDVLWDGNHDSAVLPAARIPAIVKSGDYLLAFSDWRYNRADIGRGDMNGHIDIEVRRSNDGGQTWSPAIIAAEGDGVWGSDEAGFGDAAVASDAESNNVLMLAAAGHVTYTSASRSNLIRIGKFTSPDNGASWTKSDATDYIYGLLPQEVTRIFATSGKILQGTFKKGGSQFRRIYTALVTDGGNYVIYSDDFGGSWAILGGAAAQNTSGNEAHVTELPNGDILLDSRSDKGRMVNIYAYSDKETATGAWGDFDMTMGIPAAACNGDIDVMKGYTLGATEATDILVQAAPRNGRANVQYYYKVVPALDGEGHYNLADFTSGWTAGYEVFHGASAYSSIVGDGAGNEYMLYERSATAGPLSYDIVFEKHSISQITGNRYFADIKTARTIKAILSDGHGNTFEHEYQGTLGTLPTVPAYCTVSTDGVWEDKGDHCTYTASITMPFVVSNAESTKYYNIYFPIGSASSGKSPTYLYYNSNNASKLCSDHSATTSVIDDAQVMTASEANTYKYSWAIYGDPFLGYTFKNRQSGTFINVEGASASGTQNAGLGAEGSVFTLAYDATGSYADRWTMKSGTGYVVMWSWSNDVATYNSNVNHQGGHFYLVEAPDFDALTAMLAEKCEGLGDDLGYYAYTGAAEELSTAQSIVAGEAAPANAKQLKTLINALTNGRGALNLPKPGSFLVIQGTTGGKYMNGRALTSDESVMWYGTDNKLIAYSTGLGFKNTSENASVTDATNTQTFSEAQTPGTYFIVSNASGVGQYMYENTNNVDRYSANSHERKRWNVAYATSLPVKMNLADGAYYGTINLPVAVTIPEGLKAYSAVAEGETLNLTKVVENGVLAANTPVILYAQSNVSSLAIASEVGEGATGNELRGTVAAEAVTANDNYVLSGANGVGFYKYNNTTMPGFKAYLPAAAASANKLSFRFEEVLTAIEAVESNNSAAEIFDLQGRRLSKAQKGMNIINGHKVLVK